MTERDIYELEAQKRFRRSIGDQIWTHTDLAKYMVVGMLLGVVLGNVVCQFIS